MKRREDFKHNSRILYLMKNNKRAIRRHHYERIKQRRRRYISRNGRALGQLASTPAGCSCWMCCNRRSEEGPTIQERKHTLLKEEIDHAYFQS